MSVDELIKHNSKFDLIIIDESQDVDWSNWAKIEEKLLSDEIKAGLFHGF